ncbi:hypothetical protein KOR34_15070 [Posidoniimonas corsicana]|uniref:PEP-CTERM sorting domain-containing protein n=1 Tax=Posidoniimonas corsicana TaxID=1938618 RepID=A0A5C5VEM5_9BACT|nr:hypothetical protein KOR34_15070 [Posidoniimonas corsicana]
MNKTAFCTALLAIAIAGDAAFAAPLFFTVDASQSSLSIDPTSLFGVPDSEQEQAPGSWTASYYGGIVADVTSSTIQILPTTTLVAGNSGIWGPAPIYPTTDPASDRAENDLAYANSSAPANYGTVVDYSNRPPINGVAPPSASNSAIRDLRLSLSDSSPKTLAGDGSFSEAGIQPDFQSGIVWLTYGNASFSGPYSDLSGDGINVTPTVDTAGQGTLTRVGDLLTLTLPLEFTESHFGSSTVYSGTIVATASVPEPLTATLLLPAASPLACVRRRRL